MLAVLLLLSSVSGQVERCSSLVRKHTCPYGGTWVTWLQAWSGFDAQGNYAAANADPYYYYDKNWPNLMEQGLDVTVTAPGCALNDRDASVVPTGVCDPTNGNFCTRSAIGNPAAVPPCPYTKYDINENQQMFDSSDNKTRYFRPGGFKYGIMAIYNQPPVCVCVDNSYDRRVEVAVESLTPRARICVRDATKIDTNSNENPGEVADCDEGRFYKCFTTQTNHDLIFRIYCDSGCEDENVQLWYRIRMSPYRWTISKTASGRGASAYPTEMWCDDLPGEEPTRPGANRMQYPLDVADVVPDNYKYPQDTGASARVGISTLLIVISSFVASMMC